MICAGSRLSILLTVMKYGSSRPSLSTTGKYFWWLCIDEINASGGHLEKRLVKAPAQGHGPLHQAAYLVEQVLRR
jgi:hypothetical protein